jgi:hypothetical protein
MKREVCEEQRDSSAGIDDVVSAPAMSEKKKFIDDLSPASDHS